MAASVSRSAGNPESATENSALRGVVSLVLFIHLFCVGVVLSSNLQRSVLQTRLVSLFSPYTQLLHFDPDFVLFHYTSGLPQDDDALLRVALYPDANTRPEEQTQLAEVTLPSSGTRWLGDRQRFFALSRVLALQAELDNDDMASEIARGVAARLIAEQSQGRPASEQAHWAVVQCVRIHPPPLEQPEDQPAESVVYVADVRLLEDGQWSVTRRQEARDVAPVRGGPAPTPTAPSNR